MRAYPEPAEGASGENALRPRIKSGAGSPCEGRGHYERAKQSQLDRQIGLAAGGTTMVGGLYMASWRRRAYCRKRWTPSAVTALQ